MTKIEARTLKGFRDYAPKEQLARQQMFAKIQSVFERFGFMPLSTPALEYKEILLGKYGDEEKLVYSFKDNGDRDVALRYDLTVPFARFVAQNQGQLTYPFKRYQIAPVWRAENTQKGRLREFYQCDVDIVGTENEFLGPADAEVIACFATVLEELGVDNYVVRLNDRFLFSSLTRGQAEFDQIPEVLRCIDKLDKIGIEAVEKLMEERGVLPELRATVLDFLSWGKDEEFLSKFEQKDEAAAASVKFWRKLIDTIVALGVPREKIVFDPVIARGLDYYTSTVFEFGLTGVEGYGSVVGGGRYNDLLTTFSEKSMPAVGGSLGIDRLYEYLEASGKLPGGLGVEVAMLNMGEATWPDTVRIATELRAAGIRVDLYYDNAKLEKQFKYAESKGARIAVMVGEDEKQRGVVKVKNLQTREQVEVKETELLQSVIAQ